MTGPGGASVRTGRMHDTFGGAAINRPAHEREMYAQSLERAAKRWKCWAKRRQWAEPEDAKHARGCAARALEFAAELREGLPAVGVVSEEPGDLPEG